VFALGGREIAATHAGSALVRRLLRSVTMNTSIKRFRDREEAGRELGAALRALAGEDPVVLALPRGGAPVALEVARALSAPLDVWIVRKIGVPWHPELGMGAVAEGNYVHLTRDVIGYVGISDDELEKATEQKRREVEERVRKFRAGRPPPELRDRTVIVVDDGIATGGTVRAAIGSIRAHRPKAIVLAVPVAAPDTVKALEAEVDRLVCLATPRDLHAIGLWYEDFGQVSDDEVVRILARAREERKEGWTMKGDGESLVIPVGNVELEGDLALPARCRGLVLFAHGSGSSRKSSRNRHVAQALRERGLGTLLFDLLTAEEEREDMIDAHLRFDIPLLAKRLGEVTDWVCAYGPTKSLSIGYFGASTGAAAALIAAGPRPVVRAVVSRGGRPDLAREALGRVRAPTLLIVGGADTTVLDLNRQALERISAPKRLTVVPRATHLFEEPGALDEVARLAGDFFVAHLDAVRETQPISPAR
jgi:putative phosphoribosyl transferase